MIIVRPGIVGSDPNQRNILAGALSYSATVHSPAVTQGGVDVILPNALEYTASFPQASVGGDIVTDLLIYSPTVHSPNIGGINIAPSPLGYQANVRSPTVAPTLPPIAILGGFENVLTVRNQVEDYNIPAGDNRVLVVAEFTRAGAADPVTAVSYGGQAMTKVIGAATVAGPDMDTGLWILNEAGIAAATDQRFVLVPTTTGVSFRLAAGSYANVDQSDPVIDEFATTDDSNGNPVSEALTTRDEGFVVADAIR